MLTINNTGKLRTTGSSVRKEVKIDLVHYSKIKKSDLLSLFTVTQVAQAHPFGSIVSLSQYGSQEENYIRGMM